MSFRASIYLAVVFAVLGQSPLVEKLAAQDNALNQATASRELSVTIGKSVLVDSPQIIERVAVSNGDLAEAVVISPHEIMVNGKAAGGTSLSIWQESGDRFFFDLSWQRHHCRTH